MARDLMDDTYYTATRGAKIPIKWTAPEVCMCKHFMHEKEDLALKDKPNYICNNSNLWFITLYVITVVGTPLQEVLDQ